MNKWKNTIEKFIKEFKKDNKIIGALVCGSYVTGSPSVRSDIDLHLILPDTADFRERGNIYKDGYLIEYLVNPQNQILKYFFDDHKNNRQMSIIQFITGEILFEEVRAITSLKNTAKKYFDKQYQEILPSMIEIYKYSIWDMIDNLEDSFEKENTDFKFIYFQSIYKFYEFYAKFLRLPVVRYEKLLAYFTDSDLRKRYLLEEFPDNKFVEIYKKALSADGKVEMIQISKNVVNYLHQKMGGLNIDGWKVKMPLIL
ncbi:MAG: nucleotidyltransferase domain-containing protein [Patescibacteria group bacterium]|nr:nucleotidyltransferase domain-containing protein [Patescibacteria group bacterium]